MNLASLRVRVTSWYGGLFAIALIVFGAAVWLGLRNYLLTTMEQALRNETGNIVDQCGSHFDEQGSAWVAGEIQESYPPEGDGRYIRIFRNDQVIYQSGKTLDAVMRTVPPTLTDILDKEGYIGKVDAGTVGPILIYTRPWVSPSGIRFVVQAGASTGPIDRILRSLLIALSILTPLILVGAAVGGYLLMNVPFRPVVALTRQAEQIGAHAPGERLPVIPTGDELERLSISLNRMIDRLEDALAHNRRFSADVSHELRTALTIMRGELEPLVEDQDLPTNSLDAIGSVLEEIDRMSDIVESLLAISKLDFPSLMPRSPVNRNALALSPVEQMQLLADDKHLTIHASAAGETWVSGDPVRLQQVIVNLLDNAIKYTPTGGQVWLEVSAQRNRGVIEVRDNGIGIPPECLPFVFDRFYRADKARTRESGGTGLGLSIVKAICTAHDGAVTIQSREGAGTEVRVELPLCSASEIAEAIAAREAEEAKTQDAPAGSAWNVESDPAADAPGSSGKSQQVNSPAEHLV